MSELVVIVPTKGRPASARRLYDAIKETSDADVAFAIDQRDPTLPEYDSDLPIWVVPGGSRGMVWPLNFVASKLLEGSPYQYLSFMGDDHMPRTSGWDKTFIDELERMKVGVVYGNDLLMGERIPTAVTMTANIPRKLGYMAPSILQHLFVDNVWKDWGQGTNLRYFPDVIIEHNHPLAGKADWDPTYESCNTPNAKPDKQAYDAYVQNKLQDDIQALKVMLD